ncbi:hypothetical protein THRCLA_07497 [Thraustotheca clavata]|uniref:Macro domain-containing protein n=1 Tax=Thraustotheca clavata TaxID=74557 RepID=A0A1V9ZD55_9STRA|nr:hypothetical protein THRCLA_07497 [Thraustotheca clavata]
MSATFHRWGDANVCVQPAMALTDAPFHWNPELNAKIVVVRDDLWTLEVDAIVNPTNESLTDASGICGRILEAAGEQIYIECSASDSCRTGDAVVTRGCQLPAKKIIHTVGPRYNPKYKIAAESALHGCYHNSMRVAIEEKIQSIAFPCLYSKKKNYPREDATHVALRAVRRMLDHYSQHFECIIFCIDDDQDMLLYMRLLPFYFPRSEEELIASRLAFKSNPEWKLGDAFGEPVIEERKIRINSSIWSDNQTFEESSDIHTLMANSYVTKEFCTMTTNPDEDRAEMLKKIRTKYSAKPQAETYQSCVEKAKNENFDDITSLQLIYRAGFDHAGIPIVMVVGRHLPVKHIDLDRILLYVIHVMDSLADRQYSVVYLHGGVDEDNQPNTTWLKRLFKTFSSKYRENLKTFYVVEATVWLKVLLWVGKSLGSRSFGAKIAYLDTISDLDRVAPSLKFPDNSSTYKSIISSNQDEED